MTAAEESYLVGNFSNLLIWGINATCLDAGGSPYPATCPPSASWCSCNASTPEAQRWVLNMEDSLQVQGARLHAEAQRQGKGGFFVLGYIEYLSIQQYYGAQMALVNNATWAETALLRVASKGLIDCMRDGCDWQGTEYRQYDLRVPAVQAYYVNQVIGQLISNPGLDGTFLDSIDWWATTACDSWPCTPEETVDLTLASLTTLRMTLQSAADLDKIISVSSHTSLSQHRDYYLEHLTILSAYKSHAIRFWEFWTPREDYLASLIYETQTLGLAAHVHAQERTLSPAWEELAVFLLGASEGSYFSVSKPWNIDSFLTYPEFSLPLGPPAGPAVNTTTQTPRAAWTLLPGQNLIFGLPPPPPWSPSPIPGTLAFLGSSASAEACLALVRANVSLTAMTWVGANDTTWSLTCWGRADAQDWGACIDGQVAAAPCWAAAEGVCVSAVASPLTSTTSTWTRDFEHVRVTWTVTTPGNSSAVFTPLSAAGAGWGVAGRGAE